MMVRTHQDSREEGTAKPIPPQKFAASPHILKTFNSCTIESILTGCITAWYGNCSASDRKALERVVRTPSTSLGPSFLLIRTSIPIRHYMGLLLPISPILSCRTYRQVRYSHKTLASLLSLEFLSKLLEAGFSPIELHFYGIVCQSM